VSLRDLRRQTDAMLAVYQSAVTSVRREKKALKRARANLAAIVEARAISQQIAEEVQRKAHKHIAKLVSRCLQAIFDDPYEFVIRFEQKRGRTEARLVFVRDGEELDPKTSVGGGVLDVTAFALRLSVLLTKHPQPRRLLILDEPFRFVSAEYRKRVRILLETLAKELDFQFIIVTHIPDFEIGNVIRL
jgi:DNA repair exonuclease SbcCD ATPase subunit